METLKREVAAIEWWHTIDLGHGVVTPGVDPSAARLPQIRFPIDLTNKTVLDIGAWDGFFSFEAERRGASRVLATDHFCWSCEGWGTKAGFDLPMLHAVRAAVTVPVIASGGAGAVGHFAPAVAAGADAVLAASVFHFRELTIGQVKAAMAAEGITVR